MARPKTLKNRVALVTNVEVEFKQRLDRIAEQISESTGKVITVSEMMRIALERVFPELNYEYLYPDEWPIKGKKKMAPHTRPNRKKKTIEGDQK